MAEHHPPLVLWLASCMWRAAGHKQKLRRSFAQAQLYIGLAQTALDAESEWANGVSDDAEVHRMMQEFNRD